MSYMRGDVYIWADGERVHFWAADGEDGWEESGWAEGRATRSSLGAGGPASASGVCLRQEIADAYAMMRLAELVDAGALGATIDLHRRQTSMRGFWQSCRPASGGCWRGGGMGGGPMEMALLQAGLVAQKAKS